MHSSSILLPYLPNRKHLLTINQTLFPTRISQTLPKFTFLPAYVSYTAAAAPLDDRHSTVAFLASSIAISLLCLIDTHISLFCFQTYALISPIATLSC